MGILLETCTVCPRTYQHVTLMNDNRNTALERSVIDYWGRDVGTGNPTVGLGHNTEVVYNENNNRSLEKSWTETEIVCLVRKQVIKTTAVMNHKPE